MRRVLSRLDALAKRRDAEQYPVLKVRPPRPLPPDGKPRRVIVIPDSQCKPGAPNEHMEWAGRHIANRKPNVVVHLGDNHDFPSLSSYNSPREQEGQRLCRDVEAGNVGIDRLMRGMGRFRPERMIVTLGNHEDRLTRFLDANPVLVGSLSLDLAWASYGWEVVPFLQPITVYGVTFCHYFPRGPNGKVTQSKRGAPNALQMIKREMRSCVAGHLQGLDVAIYHTGERTVRGIIAGSFYMHAESYLTPQGSDHWYGILELNEVWQGNFDVVEVSLDYLRRRYGS